MNNDEDVEDVCGGRNMRLLLRPYKVETCSSSVATTFAVDLILQAHNN